MIRTPAWEPETRALLDAFSRPFTIGEYAFGIGASLGIATARPGEDAHAVLANADAAVDHAKNEGAGARRSSTTRCGSRSATACTWRTNSELAWNDPQNETEHLGRRNDRNVELVLLDPRE